MTTQIELAEFPGDVQRIMRKHNIKGKIIDLQASLSVDMPLLKKTDDTRYVMINIMPAGNDVPEPIVRRHVGNYTLRERPVRAESSADIEQYQTWVDQRRVLHHEPHLVYLHLLETRYDGAALPYVKTCAVSLHPEMLRRILAAEKYPDAKIIKVKLGK